MKNIINFFTKLNIRQIIYTTLIFSAFGVVSLNHLLTNDPDNFRLTGSFITIFSLINIVVTKNRYEKANQQWRDIKIWKKIRYEEERNNFRDASLNLTFDLHGLHIAQISAELGGESAFCEPSHEALKEFSESVQKRFDEREEFLEKQQKKYNEFMEFEDRFQKNVTENSNWSSLFFKLEILLALWGTFQGAYGGEIVAAFHQI